MVKVLSLLLCLLLGGTATAETLSKEYFEHLFRERIMAQLPYDPQDIEITRFQCQPKEVSLPEGQFTVQVSQMGAIVRPGLVTMLVDITSRGRLVRRVRLLGRLEIYQKVPVLKRDLPRGSEITSRDLSLVRFPLSRLPQDLITDPEELKGKILKRSLRAGLPLRSSFLRARPLVHRGEMVTIVAESGSLRVTALGEAREDGAKGEIIRVRNLASRKEIMARVAGPNLVKVRF
ncbi:flagellar basal body P-ring formation protein FlgA [Thermosulfuriphilus ammonigenes]|uniref:Flagella basal body P-ring formation protein FlgA n=1 Tax=Thermosulfuriphilus ammonigenes TaxID=1936021 RepID=A0A6G7PZ32_9BACT|nr:flagellar basal body P-ring formation chaperone FlgA [Thermosulfuriphilus ammonigenes]MBA2849788.1 flagella basal body P-ring formation protein FlgA [Thermosulfuriphilus ammonigenes]QIJ72663.1 flagellar basal body P-ring formation protein FlgA [Thermosulfuriphilus ammonigenes]